MRASTAAAPSAAGGEVRRTSTAPAPPSKISLDDFKSWTDYCRPRRIQQEYIKVMIDARAKGCSVEEELHSRGFANLHEFRKKCAKFNVTCGPLELAELGSGYVLYFHFLRFLFFLLVVIGLAQIPMLVYYGGERSNWMWLTKQDGDKWTAFFDNQDVQQDTSLDCACLGKNEGERGPFSEPRYGEYCNQWDLAACSGPNPRAWCCRSWCFASPRCPIVRNATSPSLSSVRFRGMVRTVATCPQDLNLLNSVCANFLNRDEPFPSDPIATGIIDWAWLTPGNVGPDQADRSPVLNLYLACIIFMCFAVVAMNQHQLMTDSVVDAATTMPRDFAILVSGLPTTATDEKQIADFFSKHAVNGGHVEVVKVLIGWSAEEFKSLMNQVKDLRRQLNKLQLTSPQSEKVQVTKAKIQDLKSKIEVTAPGSKLESSGLAVVVFRKQSDLRLCLHKWSGFWQEWMNVESARFGWISCPGTTALPRFPTGAGNSVPIRVEQAPNPGDIQWEELQASQGCNSTLMKLKTNFCMLVLLAVCFLITWGLIKGKARALEEAKSQKKDGKETPVYYTLQGISFLPALVICIVNLLLGMAARKFGAQEYHETWTSQEFSQAYKISFAIVFNTSGIIFWTNATPWEWYTKGGLVDQIFYMMIMDAILNRILLVIDVTYLSNFFARRSLTQARVDQWNDTIGRCSPPKTTEQAVSLEDVRQEVEGFKTAFEPEEFDNPYRYAMALATFICSVFYAPLLPFGVYLGALGILLQYLMDKLLLLRWNKRPSRPQNKTQATWSLRYVRWVGPCGLAVGTLVFLTPSWRRKPEVWNKFIVSAVICIFISVLPMKFWRTLCGCRLCMGKLNWKKARSSVADQSDEDYYHAQHMWPREMKYHTDHFVYSRLPKLLNPEILVPKVDHCVRAEDIKEHLAQALGRATYLCGGRSVIHDAGDALSPMRGGIGAAGGAASGSIAPVRVVGPAAGAAMPTAAAVIPTTYGTGAAFGMPAEGTTVRVPTAASAGSPLLIAAPFSGSGGTSAGLRPSAAPAAALKRGVWEFETRSGFSAFPLDCQDQLERALQEHRAGRGPATVLVDSKGTKVTVDVVRMTQQVVGMSGGRIRQVRRLEME